MILLLLGIFLWAAAHFFKRAAPEKRAEMAQQMGKASKGLIAGVLALSVVLMVVGYRLWTPTAVVYVPPSWGAHLNNLLMLLAVGLFGLCSSKSPLRSYLRHPMLLGVVLWSVAHLLANGNLAALVLFGFLGLWAIAEIFVINATAPAWQPYQGGTRKGTIRLVAITFAVYIVIGVLHGWIGAWPFG